MRKQLDTTGQLSNPCHPIEVSAVDALAPILGPLGQVPDPLGAQVRVQHLAKATDGVPPSDNPDVCRYNITRQLYSSIIES